MINHLELYFKAAQSAKIGIWEINLVNHVLYWDTVTKYIHEVSDDYIPTIENSFTFYSENERTRVKNTLNKAINEGTVFNEKFQIITAKNNIKYIESICQVELKDGKTYRVFGTIQDITNEQNLINELQLNVEKFSSIFSGANDAIFIIDSSSGCITDCNSISSKLTGYSHSELIGMNKFDLFPDDHKDKFKSFLNKDVTNDNYIADEIVIKTKFGTKVPVEIAHGKEIQVSNQTFLVCFFRDISVRKNAEEKMNMLSLAASETTDTIIIANSDCKAVWANNAYLELTGLSLNEILGEKPGYLSKGPDTNQDTTDKMRKAIQNKESIKVTILNYKKNKEKYWFELNITPIFDNQNNLINFVGVGRDITIKKEKELQLKKLLDVTSDQNKKLLNFSHIVSHNIRSHASNLSMVLDLMEQTVDPDEKISYISLFKEGTEKLSETIEYLNEIITIQKNTNITKTRIRLKDEIEKTKRALSLVIRESQIKIVHSIPDDFTVLAIPAYLDSILLNLFTNAIKYKSPERQAVLEIDHETDGNYTFINFKDNGLGIDLEKNGHKIFGMYKTFHGNEDAKGIGLFITKNQLKAMGGKIDVESKVGRGSTFKVFLNEK
ncbi:PAS domain-containing sensor histidine kinase [Flavobacterium maritimum]|uniref:PAS domain-containing sensor histidine kinase n=1 Tax=Flavobacterium maritimum TaxID=3149042 RepID=UPI0032B31545